MPIGPFAGQVLALCIASHHSGLIDCIAASQDSFGEDTFTRRIGKAGTRTYLDEVVAAAHPEILRRAAELLGADTLPEALTRLALQVSLANKSNQVPMVQQWGLIVRLLFSCLIDADRIDTANFENIRSSLLRQSGTYVPWDVLAERLETYLSKLQPRQPIDEIRREISQHCFDSSKIEGGIYTLTVPTGGGKTLASLRFALQHAKRRKLERVLYVIPFTSIIDQNAEAIRKVLEQTPEEQGRIVLEHHSSLTPERQSWREKLLSENWDAPIILTTMVQFLDTLFGAGTRGARRMHQLANSIIVFDEVQTLPIRCVHLFNNAVNFLAEQCNATVVLCTATQPVLHQVSPEQGAIRLSAQHEIVPNRHGLFERLKRVEIMDARRPGGWTHEAVAALSLQEVRRKGSCLVIVNTKKSARRIYEVASELSSVELVHLSTHMCPAHRKQRLYEVRERLDAGLPVLCISTQLIEAGVDVDFGVVIRALAGIDSIAQAAGRCNRNGAPEPFTWSISPTKT
jgi:CRISPR-associated endonuclease/helicase Cas3